MAEQTPNYNLTKPDINEFYDVEVQNNNMDIIDSALKGLEEGKATSADLTSIEQTVTKYLEETVTFLLTNTTYYVNAVSGNDSNDGLSTSTAFKTITKAIESLPKNIRSVVTINLAVGTYNEVLELRGFIGDGTINIRGASVVSDDVTINQCLIAGCTAMVRVNGCKFTSNNSVKVVTYYCTSVNFNLCKISDSANYSGFEFNNTLASVTNSHISNQSVAILSANNSTVYSDSNFGSGNSIGLMARSTGTIGKNGTQASANTAESISSGGVIR